MNHEKWEFFKRAARGEEFDSPPVALIVDSPWIPGYLDISTLDYMTVPEDWLDANLRIERQFPEITFLPGFWAEIGMCAEPSGFGCKVSLYADKTPVAYPMIAGIEELDRVVPPNPLTDGFMPLVLNFYRRLEPRINDAGHVVKMVAARGPLTTASHLMGVSNFLVGMKLEPAATHRLLRTTTTLVKDWLHAQAEALKEVESVLVLDDIAGMMSPQDYLEFAHPYIKEIFAAFPGSLKVFHNDTDNPVSYKFLCELGIDVFNFTHLQPLGKVRELVGPEICLLGNVSPRDVLALGTPQQVRQAVRDCLAQHPSRINLILSAGGGTSPGTPAANLRALVEAATNTA